MFIEMRLWYCVSMVLQLDSKALQDTEGKQQKQKQCLHMSWGSVAVVCHVAPFFKFSLADGWAGSWWAEGPDLSNGNLL